MVDKEFDDYGRLRVYKPSEYRPIYDAITGAFDGNGVPDIKAINDVLGVVFSNVNVLSVLDGDNNPSGSSLSVDIRQEASNVGEAIFDATSPYAPLNPRRADSINFQRGDDIVSFDMALDPASETVQISMCDGAYHRLTYMISDRTTYRSFSDFVKDQVEAPLTEPVPSIDDKWIECGTFSYIGFPDDGECPALFELTNHIYDDTLNSGCPDYHDINEVFETLSEDSKFCDLMKNAQHFPVFGFCVHYVDHPLSDFVGDVAYTVQTGSISSDFDKYQTTDGSYFDYDGMSILVDTYNDRVSMEFYHDGHTIGSVPCDYNDIAHIMNLGDILRGRDDLVREKGIKEDIDL